MLFNDYCLECCAYYDCYDKICLHAYKHDDWQSTTRIHYVIVSETILQLGLIHASTVLYVVYNHFLYFLPRESKQSARQVFMSQATPTKWHAATKLSLRASRCWYCFVCCFWWPFTHLWSTCFHTIAVCIILWIVMCKLNTSVLIIRQIYASSTRSLVFI